MRNVICRSKKRSRRSEIWNGRSEIRSGRSEIWIVRSDI